MLYGRYRWKSWSTKALDDLCLLLYKTEETESLGCNSALVLFFFFFEDDGAVQAQDMLSSTVPDELFIDGGLPQNTQKESLHACSGQTSVLKDKQEVYS